MRNFVVVFGILLTAFSFEAASFDLRIVNGTNADIKDFPFMASLLFGKRHLCGVTILSNTYVLTAAHCVFNRTPQRLRVQFGFTKIQDPSEYRNVKHIEIHEKYQPYDHDLAVLQLDTPITFQQLIQPVKLTADAKLPAVGTLFTILGWGDTIYELPHGSEVLQKAEVPLYSDYECEKAYSDVTLPTNSTIHICAGYPSGGIDSCHGDSGGALVLDGVQYGITSYGRECGLPNYPGVYTRISSYLDWIKSKASLS